MYSHPLSVTPRSNRTFILISVCIALCFLVYGILNYRSAFPEIGIEFNISRVEALSKARDFLEVRRFDINGYKESIIFTYDVPARLFLERQTGVERTTSLTRDSVKVWFWKARFYQPMQKLEYQVFIDPRGEVIGFERNLPESAPGRSFDPETARILAEAFLRGPKGIDLDQWRLVDQGSINHSSRRDHRFTYQWKDFRIRDESGTPRLENDDIIGFPDLLKIVMESDNPVSVFLRERFSQQDYDLFKDYLTRYETVMDKYSAADSMRVVRQKFISELNTIIESQNLSDSGIHQAIERDTSSHGSEAEKNTGNELAWFNRNLLSVVYPDHISRSFATYRLEIEVQGAEVGKFRYYLKVPDQWNRNYYRQRDLNDRFQNVAELLAIMLAIAAVVCLVRNTRLNQAPWRVALVFGTILFAVNFIKDINSLPLEASTFVTTESHGAFLGRVIIYSLINGLLSGLLVMMLIGAGEPLYRKNNPTRLYLPGLFTRRGFQTSEFLQATLMGYVLAAFHVGFVVFYYLWGKKVGFWTPGDISYDNALSTTLPWMYPLGISTSAALIEEFWFRFFGISFLKKVLKSNVLAVIIPALIWGFLHSSYPQQPGFARGIEVSIIGILAGIIMLRFGIWAVLVWHFVVDAIWTGLFLFQSGDTRLWISGLIVCSGLAVPALFALFQRIRNRSPIPDTDLLNLSISKPAEPKTKSDSSSGFIQPRSAIKSTSLKPFARKVALVAGSTGIIISLFPVTTGLGDFYNPQISRTESIEIAKEVVKERYSDDPQQLKIAATDNGFRIRNSARRNIFETRLSYVKKYGSLDKAKQIFFSPDGIPLMNWIILLKKELDPKAYVVSVDQTTGEAYSSMILPETATGAKLTPDSARKLAEQAFHIAEPNHALYQLVDIVPSEKVNRIDYAFTWETVTPVVKDAHYRRKVRIIGDEAEVGWRILKIPESWERYEMSRSARWVVIQVLTLVLLTGAFIGLLILLRKKLPKIELPWRKGFILASVVLAAQCIAMLNDLSTMWWGYETGRSISSYLTMKILGMVLQVVILSSISFLVITLALGFNRARYGTASISSPGISRTAAEESVLGLFGSIGLILGIEWLIKAAGQLLHMPGHSFVFDVPGHLSSFLPWIGEIAFAVKWAVLGGALVSILFLVIDNVIPRRWFRWITLAFISIVTAGYLGTQNANPTNSELAWDSIRMLGLISAGYIAMCHWIKGRIHVLITAFFVIYMLKISYIFSSWIDSPYRLQGLFILLVAVLPLLLLIVRTFKKRPVNSAG